MNFETAMKIRLLYELSIPLHGKAVSAFCCQVLIDNGYPDMFEQYGPVPDAFTAALDESLNELLEYAGVV